MQRCEEASSSVMKCIQKRIGGASRKVRSKSLTDHFLSRYPSAPNREAEGVLILLTTAANYAIAPKPAKQEAHNNVEKAEAKKRVIPPDKWLWCVGLPSVLRRCNVVGGTCHDAESSAGKIVAYKQYINLCVYKHVRK